MGLLGLIQTFLLYGLGLFAVVVLLPGLPPDTTFPFERFSFAPFRPLEGVLSLNDHLDNAERLLEGDIHAPEALIADGADIYTTVLGGDILRIRGESVTPIAKFGIPCDYRDEEKLCGRPLGLAFDGTTSALIVADAYYGIWQVNVATGAKTLLVSPDTVLEGEEVNRKARLFNSVAVAKNGDIYWTDSTSDFHLHDGLFSVLGNPAGRLFRYDRKQKTNSVLLDRLYFANGVALSPGEDFVVVAETMAARVHRYYLKGPKAGTHDIFIDGVPGLVDNLSSDSEGLWVPLHHTTDEGKPNGNLLLANFSLLRKFASRLLALVELPFKRMQEYAPNDFCKRMVHAIGHFTMATSLAGRRATILRLDWNGNIVFALHGHDRSVGSVSHVLEVGEHLYLGSPYNPFLARVTLPKEMRKKIKISNSNSKQNDHKNKNDEL